MVITWRFSFSRKTGRSPGGSLGALAFHTTKKPTAISHLQTSHVGKTEKNRTRNQCRSLTSARVPGEWKAVTATEWYILRATLKGSHCRFPEPGWRLLSNKFVWRKIPNLQARFVRTGFVIGVKREEISKIAEGRGGGSDPGRRGGCGTAQPPSPGLYPPPASSNRREKG